MPTKPLLTDSQRAAISEIRELERDTEHCAKSLQAFSDELNYLVLWDAPPSVVKEFISLRNRAAMLGQRVRRLAGNQVRKLEKKAGLR